MSNPGVEAFAVLQVQVQDLIEQMKKFDEFKDILNDIKNGVDQNKGRTDRLESEVTRLRNKFDDQQKVIQEQREIISNLRSNLKFALLLIGGGAPAVATAVQFIIGNL